MTHWTDRDGTLHEIYTAAFHHRDAYLGSFSYDSGRADLRYQRSSLAYFCPRCGDVWCRLACSDSRGVLQEFLCTHAPCPDHPSPWGVAGSLLRDHAERLLDSFPADAIRYEFTQQMKEALK